MRMGRDGDAMGDERVVSLPQNHSTMDEEYEECEGKNVH